ncbi:unnamed protein product [Blepharisma stoltei]|uniref:1-phosphatidylinositol 4-kinase n=1 Tax=Blepharisma stoltei TaxID=1481888 RepID=A0AAU9JBY9_9CILI|nr:unnamed protein product [Blepharisma stoltei]
MSSDGSLLRFFNSEYFTLEHLLYYLHKREEPGIRSFLVNKLYTFPLEDISFYIPQLMNLIIERQDSEDLERFFLESSIKSHDFAIKFYWFLNGALNDEIPNKQDKLERISHDLEMVIVNATLPKQSNSTETPHLFPLDLEESEIEKFSRKSIRNDYFNYQQKSIGLLCKISVALLTIPLEQRNEKLKNWLSGMDSWLKETKQKYHDGIYSDYAKRIFRGIFIPFKFVENPDKEISQVVKIISEESCCFCTKARVPYKLLMETVEMSEIEPTMTDRIQIETNGVNITVDQEVEEIDVSQVDKMVNKENERFQGFEDYAEEVQKTEREGNSVVEDSENNVNNSSAPDSPWGESWSELSKRIKNNSSFGQYNSWKLRAIIVKGLDDLRQEYLAMQFIKKLKLIFDEAHLSIFLRPYDILVVSHNMGMIEFMPDTLSIHAIKKNSKNYSSLLDFYLTTWSNNFEEAQKNFIDSLAGYSLLCYILNIKDRHNGNILIDGAGHIIHIDFGFLFTNSPGGNINFETAPFKLTKEMIELMGGMDSEMFRYYKCLLIQGFLELRKHVDKLEILISMMAPGRKLPCFRDFDRAVHEFRERFHLSKTDEKCIALIDSLVYNAANNWRTNRYDAFQRYSNGIL